VCEWLTAAAARGLADWSFAYEDLLHARFARGHLDDGSEVRGGRLRFPALAAGAVGESVTGR
jgi:hypothetical protein